MKFTSTSQRHAYEQAARGLPDAMFADDPRIVALTQAIPDLEEKARIAREAALDPKPVQQAIEGIKSDLLDVGADVASAITRDLVNKDYTYPHGTEALERAESLERRLKAAQLAVGIFETAIETNAGRAAAEAAQAELNRAVAQRREVLRECKYEHLRAHRHQFKLP